jgi:hypothetical protein
MTFVDILAAAVTGALALGVLVVAVVTGRARR